ncbi:hypothetical protein MTO96_041158 [Rhipicephalus appendiculatus]
MLAYDCELVHRTGKKYQNADALSRLPLDTTIDEPPPPGDILMFEALPKPPLTADMIAASTQECIVLKEVYAAIQEGNVQKLRVNTNAYRKRATELGTHHGCITLGIKSCDSGSTSRTSHVACPRKSSRHCCHQEVCQNLYVVAWYQP